jgi:hypothetical protein
MLLNFLELFLIEKGDMSRGDFLEFYNYFLIKKDDVACYLNF